MKVWSINRISRAYVGRLWRLSNVWILTRFTNIYQVFLFVTLRQQNNWLTLFKNRGFFFSIYWHLAHSVTDDPLVQKGKVLLLPLPVKLDWQNSSRIWTQNATPSSVFVECFHGCLMRVDSKKRRLSWTRYQADAGIQIAGRKKWLLLTKELGKL